MKRGDGGVTIREVTVHSTINGDVPVLANVLPGGAFIHREFDGWTVRYPSGRRVGWQGVVMVRMEKKAALAVARVVDVDGDETSVEVIRDLLEQWGAITGEEWEKYADRFWETYRVSVDRGEEFRKYLWSL